jgi:hypothetical protein
MTVSVLGKVFCRQGKSSVLANVWAHPRPMSHLAGLLGGGGEYFQAHSHLTPGYPSPAVTQIEHKMRDVDLAFCL